MNQVPRIDPEETEHGTIAGGGGARQQQLIPKGRLRRPVELAYTPTHTAIDRDGARVSTNKPKLRIPIQRSNV